MMPPAVLVPWMGDCVYFDGQLGVHCVELGPIVMCTGTVADCLAFLDDWDHWSALAWQAICQPQLPLEQVAS